MMDDDTKTLAGAVPDAPMAPGPEGAADSPDSGAAPGAGAAEVPGEAPAGAPPEAGPDAEPSLEARLARLEPLLQEVVAPAVYGTDVRALLARDPVPGVAEAEVVAALREEIPADAWLSLSPELRQAAAGLFATVLLGEKVRRGEWQPEPALPPAAHAPRVGVPGASVPGSHPRYAGAREALRRRLHSGLSDEQLDACIAEYEREEKRR